MLRQDMRNPSINISAQRVSIGVCIFMSIAAIAQGETETLNILQSRGVDQRVDYQSLTKFGPWDDRNYNLTTEDLDYLSPDEDQLRDPVPAFFRVELRKEFPDLRKSGPAQYPRSAVPLFQLRHGGLKRDSKILDKSVEPQAAKPCGSEKEEYDSLVQ